MKALDYRIVFIYKETNETRQFIIQGTDIEDAVKRFKRGLYEKDKYTIIGVLRDSVKDEVIGLFV